MLCMLIRRPEDEGGLDISVEIRPGTDQADIVSGKNAALQRLASSPWTRNHGYGYLRTPDGLLKIEALEFDEGSDRVRALVVSGCRSPRKGVS